MEYTPNNIRYLNKNEVFVFGSNLDGRHGKGAALTAKRLFGAKQGVGEGLTGMSYALPTVGHNLSYMKLEKVSEHVNKFISFAVKMTNLKFLVTEVGCGLAGHDVKAIAPMFRDCLNYEHIILPKRFHDNM